MSSGSPKRFGAAVAARANSSRYDVQQSYEGLFFERTDDEFAQASRNNRLSFDEHADRPDGIEMLKRRLRAATRRHLASSDNAVDGWEALFRSYDSDGNGELDEEELRRAVRRDLQIPEHELSDGDLRRLFVKIDADNSGAISADELRDFMRWESKFQARTGDAEGSGGYVVPFVAEYYVLTRVALREGPSLDSRMVGMMSPGEIVAVTRVDGNRMLCERLAFGVKPRSGWCSEYTRGGAGEPLLEVLPRSEWGDSACNDTAIAARVSALRSAERLKSGARPTTEGASRPNRRTSSGSAGLSSTYWERHAEETSTLAEAFGMSSLDADRSGSFTARGVRASQSLADCRSGAEVAAVLALLETTPRESWEAALRGRRHPTSDAGSSFAGSARGRSNSGSSGAWEMAHPVPSSSLPRPRASGLPSASLSEKALATAAQLEAIASSLRGARVRTDLAQACEQARASALAIAQKDLR